MTDFAALLAADFGQPARSLQMLTAAAFPDWLSGQSASVQSVVVAASFTAQPGGLAIVPEPLVSASASDFDWSAVIGIGPTGLDEPWALAAAATKLPGGMYRLIGADAGLAAHGWLLAQHHFDRYRSKPPEHAPRVLLMTAAKAADDAIRLAEATALLRDLVDTPANDMGPAELAAAVVTEGERFGATVEVITGEALLAANFPAIHAVGRAAARAPRLIELRWGDPAAPKVTLVGKGVIFDSGGLNIKSGAGMVLMKKDMGGAAHALALARLIMQDGLPVCLRLIVPAVENAISGDAFRPGDVIATRAGITVEIGNTDAEGRLILADALTLAQDDQPGLLIDFATLTGAARIALGPDLPALFTHHDALAAEVLTAGIQAGDPMWRLPLWLPYQDTLKSSVADLNNSGDNSFAGAITAALFLNRFVKPTMNWLHIDLYAWRPIAKPGRPKGGAAMSLHAVWKMLRYRYVV